MFDLRDVVDDVSVMVHHHANSAAKHSKWAARLPKRAAKVWTVEVFVHMDRMFNASS